MTSRLTLSRSPSPSLSHFFLSPPVYMSARSAQLLPVVLRWQSRLLANSPGPLRRQQHWQLHLTQTHTHSHTLMLEASLTGCLIASQDLIIKPEKFSPPPSKWRVNVREHVLASRARSLGAREAHPISQATGNIYIYIYKACGSNHHRPSVITLLYLFCG